MIPVVYVTMAGAQAITVLSISTMQAFSVGLVTAATGLFTLNFFLNRNADESETKNTDSPKIEEATINLASEKKQALEEAVDEILLSTQANHQNIHQSLNDINKNFQSFQEKSTELSSKIEERKHLEEKITRLLHLFGDEESELFKALNQLEEIHLKHTEEVSILQEQISKLLILNQEKETMIEKLSNTEVQQQSNPRYCYI
jgi:chromosome segregation ATPase